VHAACAKFLPIYYPKGPVVGSGGTNPQLGRLLLILATGELLIQDFHRDTATTNVTEVSRAEAKASASQQSFDANPLLTSFVEYPIPVACTEVIRVGPAKAFMICSP
jgi:hypothetical protein